MKRLSVKNVYEASEKEHEQRQEERIYMRMIARFYINGGDSINDLIRDFEDPEYHSKVVDQHRQKYFNLKKRGELDHLLKLAASNF
jgi:hypothetical protein